MRRTSIAGQRAWAVGPGALACTAAAAPYLLTHHLPAASWILHQGFALVCHQRPERCFWIFGAPIAVCARCLGIYIGAAIGLLVRTSQTLAIRLLIAGSAITLLDGLAEASGLHGNWPEFRFVLGLALGASAGIWLASVQAGVSRVPADFAQVER